MDHKYLDLKNVKNYMPSLFCCVFADILWSGENNISDKSKLWFTIEYGIWEG